MLERSEKLRKNGRKRSKRSGLTVNVPLSLHQIDLKEKFDHYHVVFRYVKVKKSNSKNYQINLRTQINYFLSIRIFSKKYQFNRYHKFFYKRSLLTEKS